MPSDERKDDIPRIGRTPTPLERGLQVAIETPGTLDDMAWNLYQASNEVAPAEWIRQRATWDGLDEAEKDMWRKRVIDAFREEIQQ